MTLAPDERTQLLRWARSRTQPSRLVLRSRMVLLAADGTGPTGVAATLGVTPATVRLWCRRFREGGIASLLRDAPGRGRKPALSLAERETLREASTQRSTVSVRQLARELGVSAATISRWRRRIPES